jgi:hypothetical protein
MIRFSSENDLKISNQKFHIYKWDSREEKLRISLIQISSLLLHRLKLRKRDIAIIVYVIIVTILAILHRYA